MSRKISISLKSAECVGVCVCVTRFECIVSIKRTGLRWPNQ